MIRHAVLFAACLLAGHFLLAVSSKWHESTTSDELVHLTGGFSYWANHDYRLQPENGILPQRWAALPAWLMGTKFPELAGNEYWRASDVWTMGHMFFYETGDDHFPRLMAGRAMIALFSVATGALVFVWSRRFFGDAGALVSVFFFALSPTMLAHGALATSDMCMTFFFLAALTAWWWHLHDARLWVGALSAGVLGLAFVSKYSAILLIPMMLIAGVGRALAPAPLQWQDQTWTTPARKLGAVVLSLLAHGIVVFVVIWAFYGFRYTAFNPKLPPALQFFGRWETFTARLGLSGALVQRARELRVLPEAYLYGFTYVLDTVRMRTAFLNGEYSVTGWPSFFIWAFVLKTTLAALLAAAGGVTLYISNLARRGRAALSGAVYSATPLLALFVIYWASSVTSHLNIGQRHILPVYPVLFIGLGWVASLLTAPRAGLPIVGAALLGWHAWSAASIAPNFLAYFNELAGGPEHGREHLIDSSLDWGQDLPQLKDWLARNAGNAPVYLSYFGTGEPAYYHLHVHRLAFPNNFQLPVFYEQLDPGIYCISVNVVAQLYGPFQGSWPRAAEAQYQTLRGLEPQFDEYTHVPARRAELEKVAGYNQWEAGMKQFDLLRLARLCQYLRFRKPDAEIGHSILVYRLTADELRRSTASDLGELSRLVEETRTAR